MVWRAKAYLAEGMGLAKNTVKTKDNGSAKVISASKKAAKIEVGVLGPKAHSKHRGSEVTTADVAGFQEFGTETIPKRPFVSGWFDAVGKAGLPAILKDAAKKFLAGQIDGPKYVKLLGNYGVGGIQKLISAGIKPALAESTIKRKGSSKPLIDTGVLRASVSFRVVG